MRPLVLVDVYALASRGFHALPGMATRDGLPTSGLYGLASTLIKLLGAQRPRATAAALDGGPAEGKPSRVACAGVDGARRACRPAPGPLRRQLALARALVEALGFHTFVVPGWGGKDVLATLATKLGSPGRPAMIVAGDHDLLQVVRPGVSVLLLSRTGEGRMVTPTEVMIRLGVPPAMLPERDALVGNRAAGIAGVPGVGPRTAARLLLRHGSLDGILRRLHEVTPERLRAPLAAAAPTLRAHAARLRLRADVPLLVDERALAMDWGRLEDGFAILERLEFRSLLPRLASVMERGVASQLH